MSAHEVFRDLPWPYDGDRFPDNLGVVVMKSVLSGDRAVLQVGHFPGGAWAVADGVDDPNLPGTAVVACMRHVVAQNSSIASLASMPAGFVADRDFPGDLWRITAFEPEP